MFRLILVVVSSLLALCDGNARFNQRIYVQAKAINFADPTKHGFRIILHDDFLKTTLAPNLLPTMYVTAIPLKKEDPTVTKMFYPDTIYEDKQVAINDLRERSWYVVCIEWENFSRHNETTGSDCRLFRTLDRMGKTADTTIADISVPDTESQTISFRLRSVVDFPMRLTISLQGGTAPVPPVQTFLVQETADIEGMFTYLRQYTNYGKLCILEEPLISGYTAMGRFISGFNINKCYFGDLTTKDYDIQTFDSEALATRSAEFLSLPLLTLILPIMKILY